MKLEFCSTNFPSDIRIKLTSIVHKDYVMLYKRYNETEKSLEFFFQ